MAGVSLLPMCFCIYMFGLQDPAAAWYTPNNVADWEPGCSPEVWCCLVSSMQAVVDGLMHAPQVSMISCFAAAANH